MSIIITKRFEKQYLENLSKYFSKVDFINILKSKSHTFISLQKPYFKIKNNVKSISIRWILVILEEDNIVPLMVFLKKDKKYWENVNWIDYKNMILKEQEENIKDIENWDYEEY